MMKSTNRKLLGSFNAVALSLALMVSTTLAGSTQAQAQCTEILTGLRVPVGTVMTDQGNLLIAESGVGTANSGRISIVDPSGNRRTLVDGMPSAPADVGDPSGPDGLFMHRRNLFVTMGTGDVGIMGPRPGTTLENPNGPSSPIFSSVLALQFSAATEQQTDGFSMTTADEDALAQGQTVTLSSSCNGIPNSCDLIMRMVTNFPNFVPSPLADVPANIQLSNPFGIVGLDDSFYVNDGGRNLTWKVDLTFGAFSEFVAYPNIPNPLFPNVGGPFVQAVPTGIISVNGGLLVALLRGAPFPTGTSTVELINPDTAMHAPHISNLTTAIGMIDLSGQGQQKLLVLEHSSAGPFFAGPGTVLEYTDPDGMPTTIAACLTRPTSMALDNDSGTLYVTEQSGRLVAIPFSSDVIFADGFDGP